MSTRHRILTLALAAIAIAGLSGCFNPFAPRIADNRGISEPPPVPDSPRNLMRLFVWCYEMRAIAEYREIFTDDYRFAFAAADSAGNAFQDRALTRDEELESATNLFVGGSAAEPAANRITLNLDPNIIALPDSRAGKTDPWHKEIPTSVDLTIETGEIQFRVIGRARFFVVRGDSAVIPQELKDRGFGPDPNRWYIERWEDETAGTAFTTPSLEGLEVRPLGSIRSGVRIPRNPVLASPKPSQEATQPLQLDVTWGVVKSQYLLPSGES